MARANESRNHAIFPDTQNPGDIPTVTKQEIRMVASSYRPIHFKECGTTMHNMHDVEKKLSQKVSLAWASRWLIFIDFFRL